MTDDERRTDMPAIRDIGYFMVAIYNTDGIDQILISALFLL